MATIGVVAFQGDFQKHLDVLVAMGQTARAVRRPEELAAIDGLIIPGGESTTIGMLMERFGLLTAIKAEVEGRSLAIMGTCAGAILLAREIVDSRQARLGLMHITVERNAYGRQIDSFEAEMEVRGAGEERVTGVFIRAPRIVRVDPGVEVLARFEDDAVVVREGRFLALTFHPELTDDTRIHDLFLGMVAEGAHHTVRSTL